MVITYRALKSKYDTKSAPQGFEKFSKAHGIADSNTCAVRLAFAIFEVDSGFFREVSAPSGVEWFGLPTRASDLAMILNRKIGPAKRVRRRNVAGHVGIIFFDTISGFGGTGHISLWNLNKVVDGRNYFPELPRVYFWALR